MYTHDEAETLRRMSRSIQGFSRAFGRAARDGRVLEYDGVVGSVVPTLHFRSIFNAVGYNSAAELEPALPRLTADYGAAGVTAWAVWAHDSDRAAATALERTGLRVDSRPAAMAAELDAITPASADSGHSRRADDLEEVDRVLAAAYDFPAGVLVYCFPRLLEEFNVYVWRDDDGKAGCALATVEVEGDCGVTLVGTAPGARGRGAATGLMRHALADAADRGCHTTTLQSTAMGESVYERLGYRKLGAMELWELRTAPDPTLVA